MNKLSLTEKLEKEMKMTDCASRWRRYWSEKYTEAWQEGLMSGKELNIAMMKLFNRGHLWTITAPVIADDCVALSKEEILSGLYAGNDEYDAYDFDRVIRDDWAIGTYK